MKKSGKSKQPNRNKSKQAPTKASSEAQEPSRRDVFRKIRNGVIGVGVVGGSGLVLAQMVSSTTQAHDLTRVNNGKPTIVQIHDPQCPMCKALQKETKSALKAFDEDDLDYVIADIKTAKGRGFAARYGVPHVTLLLFDGAGNLQSVLRGQRPRDELRQAFELLVAG